MNKVSLSPGILWIGLFICFLKNWQNSNKSVFKVFQQFFFPLHYCVTSLMLVYPLLSRLHLHQQPCYVHAPWSTSLTGSHIRCPPIMCRSSVACLVLQAHFPYTLCSLSGRSLPMLELLLLGLCSHCMPPLIASHGWFVLFSIRDLCWTPQLNLILVFHSFISLLSC